MEFILYCIILKQNKHLQLPTYKEEISVFCCEPNKVLDGARSEPNKTPIKSLK